MVGWSGPCSTDSVNYSGLNKVSEDLAYDIPRVDDVLDSLGGCSYFTTLDLASGWLLGIGLFLSRGEICVQQSAGSYGI